MEEIIIDIIGWVGSTFLIIAYWFVSKKKIDSESFTYHGLNIAGSVMLILNTGYYGAFPSTSVNIIWVCIGFFYISRYRKKWNPNT